MNDIQTPAECKLTPDERPQQLDRFAEMSRSITSLEHDQDALLIEFDPSVDEQNVHALIAKERECCPFYRFDFDAKSRRLRIGVDDPSYAPALDAIADGLASEL